MIGNDKQSEEKCKYVGHADILVGTDGKVVLRSFFLDKILDLDKLYFISKGSGTQSIVLTPVEKKSLHLGPIDGDGYINMNGNCHHYTNLKREDSCQNINSLSNNQNEHNHTPTYHGYEYIDDTVINNNKSKTKTSLKDVIVSMLSCCIGRTRIR